MKAPHVAPAKHEAAPAKAEKKQAPKHEAAAFSSQLTHALAAVHVAAPLPHVAVAHTSAPKHGTTPAPRREVAAAARPASSPERPQAESAVRAPLNDSSARPAAVFSPEPTLDAPKMSAAPAAPPSWLPVEAALDDAARLAVFPHTMQWVSDAGSVNLQLRGSEVTLRVHGELAASMKNSDSELRVALAQRGLTLHETAETDSQPQQQPHQQQQHEHPQETDEWT